ncbi:MAG: hypothetical protein K0R81_535 [Microbacterium sp.]|nr:hypothetical protein [Microbacterium sp.]
MKRLHGVASALVAGACAALALSSCATQPYATHSAPSDPPSGSQPAYLLAHCNLGEKWDQTRMLKVARYDAPDVDDSLLEIYGPVVANGSCTDADIIRWRELRRSTGESDLICRITYYEDDVSGLTYPIGCAVPVLVVTDASR